MPIAPFLPRAYRFHYLVVGVARSKVPGSASADRTLRLWKLEGLDQGAMLNRWGLSVIEQDGAAIANEVRADGPLYFRGIRQGDRIEELILVDVVDGETTMRRIENADEIVKQLEQGPRRLTAFRYRRGRSPAQSFQSQPAWQPVASLYVIHTREWVFWAPSGYYDASFEGHKLLGWQVNRGLNQLPDFFLAAQLRNVLERPNIMSRLLDVGDIDAAFQRVGSHPPGNWSHVLAQQQTLCPQVEIVQPASHETILDQTVTVRATVQVPSGQRLAPPKAFANGVVSPNRTLVKTERSGGHDRYDYVWKMAVPSDPQVMIQVMASTENEMADEKSVVINRPSDGSTVSPRMFLIAAGVNQYRDAQIPNLAFAVDNARGVTDTLKLGAERLYEYQALALLEQNVTKSTWEMTLNQYARRIREAATPDDLLLVYLSGHGVRDPVTGKYYYVTSNARYRDIQAGRFADCLSFEQLSLLANVPCRKNGHSRHVP